MPQHILVVDDDPLTREMCRSALQGPEVEVSTANGVQEALAVLRRSPADLVISDICMGEARAGLALAEEIRSSWPETDVVIMTGNPSLGTAVPALRSRALDYLEKPFSIHRLRSLADRILAGRRLRRELDAERLLRAELAAAYCELEKVERMKAGLIGRVTHELRTPVAMAVVAAELLRAAPPEARSGALAKLDASLDRMKATVEDLLLFTQTQEPSFAVDKADADLAGVLAAAIADASPAADERGVKMSSVASGTPRRFPLDAPLVRDAFRRLLLNAVRFNKPGGQVAVSTGWGDDGVSVAIADSGEGIPEEARAHAFLGLYQAADYLTRRVGGLGVGLAIARRVVEAHGGELSVSSRPGHGSVFTATFQIT